MPTQRVLKQNEGQIFEDLVCTEHRTVQPGWAVSIETGVQGVLVFDRRAGRRDF